MKSTNQKRGSTGLALLQEYTRNPNYARGLTAPDGSAGKTWDDRFVLSNIPDYDATKDRFCKFSSVKKKRNLKSPERPFAPPIFPQAAFQSPGSVMSPAQVSIARFMSKQTQQMSPAPPGSNQANNYPVVNDLRRPQRTPRGQPTAPAVEFNLESLFTKSKHRLMKLWDELGVNEQNRVQFAQNAFTTTSVDALAVINDEIQRLLDRRNATMNVEKCIEVREGFLYLMQELAERTSSSPVVLDKDKVQREFTQLANSLRTATLDTIDALMKWRAIATQSDGVFLWKGISYANKMATDLSFLPHSRLSQCVEYSLHNNPLLDPRKEATKEGALPPLRRKPDNVAFAGKDRMELAEKFFVDEVRQGPSTTKGAMRDFGRHGDIEEDVPIGGTHEMPAENVDEESWLTSQNVRKDTETKAAITIQRVYRGFRDRLVARAKERQRVAAIQMQKIARKYLARKSTQELRRRVKASIKIQALQRGCIARSRTTLINRREVSAVKIQKCWRGHLGRKEASWKQLEWMCAVNIQRVWRGHHIRRSIALWKLSQRDAAATMIQKHWRGFLVRQDPRFNKKKQVAVVKLQAWSRGVIDRRKCKIYNYGRQCCRKIQTWWRMIRSKLAANKLREELKASSWEEKLQIASKSATKIQATWKMHIAKEQLQVIRNCQKGKAPLEGINHTPAVVIIATADQTTKKHAAAIKIQTRIRGYLARANVQIIIAINKKAVDIQRLARGMLARKMARSLRSESEIISNSQVNRTFSPIAPKQQTNSTTIESAVTPAWAQTVIHEQPAITSQQGVTTPIKQITPAKNETIMLSPVKPDSHDHSLTDVVQGKVSVLEEIQDRVNLEEFNIAIAIQQEQDYAAKIIVRFFKFVKAKRIYDRVQTKKIAKTLKQRSEQFAQETAHAAAIIQRMSRLWLARRARSKQMQLKEHMALVNEVKCVAQLKEEAARLIQCEMYFPWKEKAQAREHAVRTKNQRANTEHKMSLDQEKHYAAIVIQTFTHATCKRKRIQREKNVSQRSMGPTIHQEHTYAAQYIQRLIRRFLARTAYHNKINQQSEISRKLEVVAEQQEQDYKERDMKKYVNAIDLVCDVCHSADNLTIIQQVRDKAKLIESAFSQYGAVIEESVSKALEECSESYRAKLIAEEQQHKKLEAENERLKKIEEQMGQVLSRTTHLEDVVQTNASIVSAVRTENSMLESKIKMVAEEKEKILENVEALSKEKMEMRATLEREKAHMNSELARIAAEKEALEKELRLLREKVEKGQIAPVPVTASQDTKPTISEAKPSEKGEPQTSSTAENTETKSENKVTPEKPKAPEKPAEKPVAKKITPEKPKGEKKDTDKPAEQPSTEKKITPEKQKLPADKKEPEKPAEKPTEKKITPEKQKPDDKKEPEKPTDKPTEKKITPEKPAPSKVAQAPDKKPKTSTEPAKKPQEASKPTEKKNAGTKVAEKPKPKSGKDVAKEAKKEEIVPSEKPSDLPVATPVSETTTTEPTLDPKETVNIPEDVVTVPQKEPLTFEARMRAAVKIQCAWRCHNARFHAKWKKESRDGEKAKQFRIDAAITLQLLFKRFVCIRRVEKLRQQRALIIAEKSAQQEEMRKKLQAEHDLALRQAQDDRLHRLHSNAAGCIQRAVRSYNARFMLKWKLAERKEKREAKAKLERQLWETKAAIKMQCLVRRAIARMHVQRLRYAKQAQRSSLAAEENKRHAAALVIQTNYRGYNARFEAKWRNEKREETKSREKEIAAKREQEEGERQRRADEENALRNKQNRAALTLQCAWRVSEARFQVKWRRQKRNAMGNNATSKKIPDPSVSSKSAPAAPAIPIKRPRTQEEKHNAAVRIQSAFRQHRSRNILGKRRVATNSSLSNLVQTERRHNAARKIQTLYRQHLARFELMFRREMRKKNML